MRLLESKIRFISTMGFVLIELIGVSKTFGENLVLNDVSLKIEQGELFGIIGKSGAGKSTLVRCMNLLERPDVGAVLIDELDLMSLPAAKLAKARQAMGMVFQHFNLLHSQTVFENVALALRLQGAAAAQISEKVMEMLHLVELADKAQAYPSNLSGGQKQRVAIARALVTSPKVLLCDEATSALDPDTTNAILALLKKINHFYGITVVFITHDMDVVKKLCHRLAVMEKGKVIETMALAEAFNYPESQAKQMLFQQLSPPLPACIASKMISTPTDRPIIRLFFQGEATTVPFITMLSQEIHLNMNILLANIDRFDTVTCGVMMIELAADKPQLNAFIERCEQVNLSVEVLGYVNESLG